MPHIPTRLPRTTGVPSEFMQPPRDEHTPLPTPEERKEQQENLRTKLGLQTISMRTYEPDFATLCAVMLGKESITDDYTGQLVYKSASKPAAS